MDESKSYNNPKSILETCLTQQMDALLYWRTTSVNTIEPYVKIRM